jgi:hypothetical protein
LGYNTFTYGNVNTLYSYLKQTKISFFFSKTETRKAKQVLAGGLVPVGGGNIRKGCSRVNKVYVNVCKWKNETC